MAHIRKKEVPMRVLSLGMSRTGTSSMKAALQILGHKNVHHAYELYTHPEQANLWLKAWNDKIQSSSDQHFTPTEWDELLGPYSAITDMPAVCFAPELIKAYPEAKVILVQRELESWYKSFNSGVIETFWDNVPTTRVLSFFDPELMKPVHQLWEALFAKKNGYFHATSKEEMQSNARKVYEQHCALVRRVCPPDTLLEFDLNQGWEPLCTFLGCEIPDEPFPRVNEGEAIKGVVGEYVNRCMKRVARNIGIGVLVVGIAVRGLMMARGR